MSDKNSGSIVRCVCGCECCESMELERLDLVLAISMLQQEIEWSRNALSPEDAQKFEESRAASDRKLLRDCKAILISLREGQSTSPSKLQDVIQRIAILGV